MKRKLALFTILILLLCGYLFYSKSNKVSPVFSVLNASSDISDRLADTSGSVYGSLLDIYLFKDSIGQLQEISLSGHADLKTSISVYSQAIKTLLLKGKSKQDFVVAGVAKIAMNLPSSEEVQTPKDTTDSKNIKQQLLALRNKQQTVQQTQANEEAFQFFLQEHKKMLLKNGLIRQHELPVAIIAEVQEKIAGAIARRAVTTLDFQDLLKKHQRTKAALLTNTLRLDNGEALVIRIPASTIYNKHFKSIQEENRKLLQIMSIEGLRKKIDFYNQQIEKLNQELRLYKSLSAEGLKEFIYSNQCLSDEGLLYDCQGAKISRAEYINFRIPFFIKGIRNKLSDLDLILKKLKDEEASNSTIEKINEELLIDAMLRDTEAPWEYHQAIFSQWKKSQRDRIWTEINKELEKINVSSKALGGAATFFAIHRHNDFLEIRPQQFLDLSASVLLLDPGQNVTQVVAKANRIASNSKDKRSNSKNNSAAVAHQLIKTAEEGNLAKLKKQILKHLKNTPIETTEALINLFNPSTAQQKESEALLFEKAASVLEASNFLASIEHLSTAPKYKNDFSLYLVQLKNILEEHRDAPVDFHLNYAIRLAEVLSKIQNLQKPSQPLSVWETLQTCSKNEQAFDLENTIIKENYLNVPFNLPEEVRSTMAYIKKKDPAYYALADQTQGFPETNSMKYKDFIETQSVKSVFQKQANQYLAKRSRLQDYLNRKNTASHGTSAYPLIDFENQKTLLQLRHFDQPSSIITHSKVLQSRILFEAGDYMPAIHLLFDSLNHLIFYHPDLQWKNINPNPFLPQKIEAVINGKELNIYTEQNDQGHLALKIFNLPPADLASLCKKINKLPKTTWQKKGDFSYHLLSTKIKINDRLFLLHQAIKAPEIQTAILKTMIFTPLLPGNQFL